MSSDLSTPPSPRRPLVFLIGYRGTGKSTVAELLARELGWEWIDADAHLEQRAGRSIRTLFAEEGEPAFRRLESEVLGELCRKKRHVIATGGGVVLDPLNRMRLRAAGLAVWLTADARTLARRIEQDAATRERRPVLTVGGLAEIEQLLRDRDPHYRSCADFVVDTTGRPPEEVTAAILHLLRR